MNIDIGQILNVLISGGAVWAAIRVDIKYLWRDLGRIEGRVDKLEQKGGN